MSFDRNSFDFLFCFNGKIGGKEEGPVKTATVLSFDFERKKKSCAAKR